MQYYTHFSSKDEDAISYTTWGKPQHRAIVLIHGFLGNCTDWELLMPNLPQSLFYLAIQLPGHSGPDSSSKIPTFQGLCQNIHTLLQKLNIAQIQLVGYSMGGRVALGFLAQHPHYVTAIALLSASLGIQEAHEKQTRALADHKLAESIKHQSMETFVQTWYRLPLFGQLRHHPHFSEFIRKRLAQNSASIAEALRQFSVSQHPYFGKAIASVPCLYIAGSLDQKYSQQAQKILALNPQAHCHILAHCGHAVHIENPQKVGEILGEFLLN